MILLGINIALILMLIITFIILRMHFLRNMLFNIEVLYTFTLLFAPLIIFVVNFISLLIINPPGLPFSLIPLVIPLGYWIITAIQNSSGNRTYKKFKAFSKKLASLAVKENVTIQEKDIRIRVKNKKEVTLIFNIYSNNDEQIMKHLIANEFKNCINSTFNHYKVEILLDKKKLNFDYSLV